MKKLNIPFGIAIAGLVGSAYAQTLIGVCAAGLCCVIIAMAMFKHVGDPKDDA